MTLFQAKEFQFIFLNKKLAVYRCERVWRCTLLLGCVQILLCKALK